MSEFFRNLKLKRKPNPAFLIIGSLIILTTIPLFAFKQIRNDTMVTMMAIGVLIIIISIVFPHASEQELKEDGNLEVS